MRTAQQGVHINVGKDDDAYREIVNTLSLHEEDLAALEIKSGDWVRVTTEHGETQLMCQQAKVPQGMGFVPYGPPTCQLMGGDTGGTGMPTSKGWEVELEPIPTPANPHS